MLAFLMLICFVLGGIAGFGLPFLLYKRHGTLEIDQSDPEKDKYLVLFNLPLDEVPKKKRIILEVNPNADLSES